MDEPTYGETYRNSGSLNMDVLGFDSSLNILVLGGYGNFGARISRTLANVPNARVIVAGRDVSRARALAETLPWCTTSACIDAQSDRLAQIFGSLDVDLVIHTAGPFHGQGYGVAEAAVQAGAHYIDLADGRRFVCDFPAAMGKQYSAADRCAVTGASSLPALSSAAVAHLCAGWTQIDAIETCIAPAQSAARGVATLAGVLSYCGEPFQIWRQGAWQTVRGWSELQEVEFSGIPTRLGALCDVPDLEIFPERFNVAGSVEFRAAIEVRMVQHGFAALSALRAKGLIPQPARFAGALNAVGALVDSFGSMLGGMKVRVRGIDADGRQIQRSWHLAADHGYGPEIPCMPAILLARRLLTGETLPSGAFTGTGLLQLSEFEPEFSRWDMQTSCSKSCLAGEMVMKHRKLEYSMPFTIITGNPNGIRLWDRHPWQMAALVRKESSTGAWRALVTSGCGRNKGLWGKRAC